MNYKWVGVIRYDGDAMYYVSDLDEIVAQISFHDKVYLVEFVYGSIRSRLFINLISAKTIVEDYFTNFRVGDPDNAQ